MSQFLVDELKTTLAQDFTININRQYTLAAVRPFIAFYNSPSGTFTLTIKLGATTLDSKDFTLTEIKSDLSTSNDYGYIWKNLTFDTPVLLRNNVYTLELSSSGYTYSDTSFIGWIKEHENIYNEVTGTITTDVNNPFSFQLFEYRAVTI